MTVIVRRIDGPAREAKAGHGTVGDRPRAGRDLLPAVERPSVKENGRCVFHFACARRRAAGKDKGNTNRSVFFMINHGLNSPGHVDKRIFVLRH